MTVSENTKSGREKSASAFRTISEVSDELTVPQHVLRFWESKFTQLKPMKRAGGRRYYRPEDVQLLSAIRDLLYAEGYTIRGVQRLLKEKGVKGLVKRDSLENSGAIDTGSVESDTQPIGMETDVVNAMSDVSSDQVENSNTLPFQVPGDSQSGGSPMTPQTRAELEALLSQLRSLRESL